MPVRDVRLGSDRDGTRSKVKVRFRISTAKSCRSAPGQFQPLDHLMTMSGFDAEPVIGLKGCERPILGRHLMSGCGAWTTSAGAFAAGRLGPSRAETDIQTALT